MDNNNCQVDKVLNLPFFKQIYDKLWYQVNRIGFNTSCPNASIIVGPYETGTKITSDSITTDTLNSTNINNSDTITTDTLNSTNINNSDTITTDTLNSTNINNSDTITTDTLNSTNINNSDTITTDTLNSTNINNSDTITTDTLNSTNINNSDTITTDTLNSTNINNSDTITTDTLNSTNINNSDTITTDTLNSTNINNSDTITTDTLVLKNSDNEFMTITYDNEFLLLKSQLYELVRFFTTFGEAPNMTVLNAMYTNFIDSVQQKLGPDYADLPWVDENSLLYNSFYFPNPSPYLWVFFNSLGYPNTTYKSWYSLTPFSVVNYNSYTSPSISSTVSNSVSNSISPQVYNLFFYNEGQGYILSSASACTTTSITYTYTVSTFTSTGGTTITTTCRSNSSGGNFGGLCGIAGTSFALTTGSPASPYSVLVTAIGGGASGASGATAAISLGVTWVTGTIPQINNTRYVSAQFTTQTANIVTLLGTNSGNPNCFAYYDPLYITNSTNYRPLDIWYINSNTTISGSSIVYEYIGFIINSTFILTINGNNILFKNCVFNIKGNATNTILVTGLNVIFDNCIFRNPVSTETYDSLGSLTSAALAANTTSNITGQTVLINVNNTAATTLPSGYLYFINNYLYFNTNPSTALLSLVNFFSSIILLTSIGTTTATGSTNFYICNNTLEGCLVGNPFNQGGNGSNAKSDCVLCIFSAVFVSTATLINIYYQLNTHLASKNFLFDSRSKDFPDIFVYISTTTSTSIGSSSNIPLYLNPVNQTNYKIYFMDRYENNGSNFLKLITNYTNVTTLTNRTTTQPYMYYNIQ